MTAIGTTPFGLLTYAESYGRAAFLIVRAIDEGARMPWSVPVGTLARHCVELSLKSVLVINGTSPDELHHVYGHSIKELFAESPLDWSDVDTNDIEFDNDAVLSQTPCYRKHDRPYYILHKEHLLPFMETVFHRCLQYVDPKAKRTLRP
ncbi:hypothetical protein [Microvirga sp. TS319]|uniref:hypothetical protein n=1 Tax=Microvirga sp. TS319 TaxID=3241165 RepID=UPI00351A3971